VCEFIFILLDLGDKINKIYITNLFFLHQIFLINEDLKTFVWLPSRTSSTNAWKIFQKLGFSYKSYNPNKKVFEPYLTNTHYHYHHLFEGHEKYKLITLLRNPYSRFVSQFRVVHSTFRGESIDDERYDRFEHYLQNVFYNSLNDDYMTWWYNPTRESDFFIRQESNYEDFCSLPFIKSTELYKSGELLEICKTPIHTMKGDDTPWQEFYNQDRADIVYFNTANYFEKHGYKKESWKK
jgi:hypothetical protein